MSFINKYFGFVIVTSIIVASIEVIIAIGKYSIIVISTLIEYIIQHGISSYMEHYVPEGLYLLMEIIFYLLVKVFYSVYSLLHYINDARIYIIFILPVFLVIYDEVIHIYVEPH